MGFFYLTKEKKERKGRSGSISRVLFSEKQQSFIWTTHHYASQATYPKTRCEQHLAQSSQACFPIWSCTDWGLPSDKLLPVARCALTTPFQPYLCFQRKPSAVYFLLHCPSAHAAQSLTGNLLYGARTFLDKLPRLSNPLRMLTIQKEA